MIVGSDFPTQGSGVGIHGVDVSTEIGEIDRAVSDDWRYANARRRNVGPVQASCGRIERIDGAIGRPNENLSAADGWSSEGGGDAWQSESPFQLQSGRCLIVEPRFASGLESGIRSVGPSGPTAVPAGR